MRRAAVPLLAICVAMALVACGGSEAERGGNTVAASEENPTQATAPEAKDVTASAPEAGEGAGPGKGQDGDRGRAGESGEDNSTAGPEPGAKRVAAGVPVQPGGDNSVQVFGAEGAAAEREQAFSTLKAYLRARAVGDWAMACAQTSEEFKEQLATVLRINKVEKKPAGCPGTLRLFLGRLTRSEMRRSAMVGELLSFRVEGGYAYVIFKGADGTVRFIAMADENGEWKVNTAEPGELSPSG